MSESPPTQIPTSGASPDLETLGRVAALAAHDLNNHLQAILSSVELAIATPEIASGLLQHAAAAIDSARDLTARMLALARPDELARVVVEPAAGFRSDERYIRGMLPRSVELVLETPQERLCILAAPRRLQRCLQNLLLNAAQALSSQGGTIRIRIASVDGMVEISVHDDGRGMDAQELSRLFEPGRTTRPDGHGLGLLSVRENAAADGGELRIESVKGGGTTATLRYPSASSVPHSRPVPDAATAFRPSRESRASLRVLVVEDEPFVRQALAITLGRMGYMPFATPTIAGALELLSGVGGFAAIFLDLSLPDSVEPARAFESLRETAPGTPIVAMSGSDPRKSLEGLLDEPPVAMLTKPFSAEAMRAVLEGLAGPGVDPSP